MTFKEIKKGATLWQKKKEPNNGKAAFVILKYFILDILPNSKSVIASCNGQAATFYATGNYKNWQKEKP